MKKVKGSSIKLKSEVNISADKVLLKGKKSRTYASNDAWCTACHGRSAK